MSSRRAASWLTLAILLLATAPPAHAEGSPSPRIVVARTDAAGLAELIVACPQSPAPAPALALTIDGGSPTPPGAVVPLSVPPSLAIVVERGAGMATSGTPESTSANDALGQAELLLARMPLDAQAAVVAYAARAELLAPLGGDLAGARAALAAGQADSPATPPTGAALAEAVGLALAQLQAAPVGPRALVILAADGPGIGAALPRPADPAIAITVVGLSAAGEAELQATAAALGGVYLPYHSQDLAKLPGLIAALGARYAAITAPERLLRVTSTTAIGPGRHQIALVGCGGTADAWLRAEAPVLAWQTPALAASGGIALGLLAGRLAGGGRLTVGRRAPSPQIPAPSPQPGTDGPTERGARLPDAQHQPSYRLVVWAGERRLTHELRERQCVIGRDPGCDLQIDGPCIAALHARLTLAGDCVTLADLDSGSGTSLGPGGPRLPAHQPTEIQDGDEIWLGPEVRIALRRT